VAAPFVGLGKPVAPQYHSSEGKANQLTKETRVMSNEQHTPYDAHIAQLEQAHGETADTMPIIAFVAAERRGYLAAKQEDAPLLAALIALVEYDTADGAAFEPRVIKRARAAITTAAGGK